MNTLTEAQLTEEEKDLIFGAPEGTGVHRAVAVSRDTVEHFNAVDRQPFGKNLEKENTDRCQEVGQVQIPFVEDLFMETRYVVFPKSVNEEVLIFDHIVDFSNTCSPNNKIIPNHMKILGYVFEEVRFSLYCLQVFKHADGLGLSCRCFDGFAPALQPFWNKMKESLEKSGLLEADPVSDNEDDLDKFFESESSEDGFDLLDLAIPDNRFLNCASDPELVIEWGEDIKDPNFAQDTLLILCYNCGKAENLNYLMTTFAQQLFDAVTISMGSTMDLSLPAMRSASMFLNHIAQNAEVKITSEQIQNITTQLAKWTISPSDANTITRSLEIAQLLSSNLSTFYKLCTDSAPVDKDLLNSIRQKTTFNVVKQNVNNFLSQI